MDSVVSSLLGKALSGYFAIFFKDFKSEDFKLNFQGSEACTTLHNLAIKEEVVQEALGIANLGVQHVKIKSLAVKVKATSIKNQPIRIEIDQVDVSLSEPIDKLKPLPQVIEAFMKSMMPADGKSKYGHIEQIIDGISVHISRIVSTVEVVGRFKTQQIGEWTPPKIVTEVKNVSVYTTNDRWEVVGLATAREFNNGRKKIFVFKEANVQSVNVSIQTPTETIPLVQNLAVLVRITIKKELDNQIEGISANAIVNDLRININMKHLKPLIQLVEGFAACMHRPDTPDPPVTEIPHIMLLGSLVLKEGSFVLVEDGGKGIEVVLKNVRVGGAWPSECPDTEKLFELYCHFLGIREFSSRSGPYPFYLLQTDSNATAKNPHDDIPELPTTLHPYYKVKMPDTPPVFYMKGITRFPPQRPKFDNESKAVLNPIEIILRPESVSRLLEFAKGVMPNVRELATLDQVKPPQDSWMTVDVHNSLEDLISLQVQIQSIKVGVAASKKGEFGTLAIIVKNAQLLSHPKLDSKLLENCVWSSQGSYPNSPDDLLPQRRKLKSREHVIKYKFIGSVEFNVQSSPDEAGKCVLELPKVYLDFELSLARVPIAVRDDGTENTALDITFMEGGMKVDRFFGRLTQVQYKILVKRLDEIIPLLPMALTMHDTAKDVDGPSTPGYFVVEIEKGECVLCNDYTSEPSPTGATNIELLAGLEIGKCEMCFENWPTKEVAKVIVHAIKLHALPYPPVTTSLYNHNNFVSVADDEVPLMQLRAVRVNEKKIKEAADKTKLIEKVVSRVQTALQKAFDINQRSTAIVRLHGYRAGVNPNSAAKIITFFLKSDRNIQDFIRTGKRAAAMLKKAEIDIDFDKMKEMATNYASTVEFDFNPSFDVELDDISFYLLRDLPENGPQGNIEWKIPKFILKRDVAANGESDFLFEVTNTVVQCNKEYQGKVTNAHTFTPLSLKVTSQKKLDSEGALGVTTQGGMNELLIAVTPEHSDIFLNVLKGIKKENIQQIVDALATYMERKPELDFAVDDGDDEDTEDPLTTSIEGLTTAINSTQNALSQAEKHHGKVLANLRSLELASGQTNIISTAVHSSYLNFLGGDKKWQKVFLALNQKLYAFANNQQPKPFASIEINNKTKLEMVNNVPNCFVVASETSKFILAAANEQEMTTWVNHLLKLQCGEGDSNNGDDNPISSMQKNIEELKAARDAVLELSQQAKDKNQLLKRIFALEKQLKEKDAKINELSKK